MSRKQRQHQNDLSVQFPLYDLELKINARD